VSEIKTVEASPSIEIWVHCPNEDCKECLDITDPKDTNGEGHNEYCDLSIQMCRNGIINKAFECLGVTCSKCKTTFNVKGMAWW